MRLATYKDSTDIGACWRVARKTWKCRGRPKWDGEPSPPDHIETINPGELHLEYFECAHAFESGARYCLPCALAGGFEDPNAEKPKMPTPNKFYLTGTPGQRAGALQEESLETLGAVPEAEFNLLAPLVYALLSIGERIRELGIEIDSALDPDRGL